MNTISALITTLFIGLSLYCTGQDTIPGYYYPNKRSFEYQKYYPHRDKDEYDIFKATEFREGIAVVEYFGYRYTDSTSTGGQPAYIPTKIEKYYNKCGVIDTSGRVIVPIIYDEVYVLRRGHYYEFLDGDSTGVVDQNGTELFRLSKNDETSRILGRQYFSTDDHVQYKKDLEYADFIETKIKITDNEDLIYAHIGNRDGIYSVKFKKFIIPIDSSKNYSQEMSNWSLQPVIKRVNYKAEIELSDHHILCEDSAKFRIIDLNTLKLSEPFDDKVRILPDGQFYFEENGQKIVARDVITRKSVFDRKIVEFESYWISYMVYNDTRKVYDQKYKTVYQFIVEENNQFGVFGLNQEIIIPTDYDDLYLMNGPFFWVKEGDKWAVLNAKNEQLTPFEFIDVDQINDENFSSLLYLLNEDTTKLKLINDLQSKKLEKYDAVVRYIWNYPLKKDRKIIFPHFAYWAKKEDGCYFIDYDFVREKLEIDSSAWDRIYTVPSELELSFSGRASKGVRKNGKYGYFGITDIKYDALVINPLEEESSGYVKGKRIFHRESNGWNKYMEWTRQPYKYFNVFPDQP